MWRFASNRRTGALLNLLLASPKLRLRLMKRALLVIAAGAAGLLVAGALSWAAFALAGKDLGKPASSVSFQAATPVDASPTPDRDSPATQGSGGNQDDGKATVAPSPTRSTDTSTSGSGSGSTSSGSGWTTSDSSDGSGSSDSGGDGEHGGGDD